MTKQIDKEIRRMRLKFKQLNEADVNRGRRLTYIKTLGDLVSKSVVGSGYKFNLNSDQSMSILPANKSLLSLRFTVDNDDNLMLDTWLANTTKLSENPEVIGPISDVTPEAIEKIVQAAMALIPRVAVLNESLTEGRQRINEFAGFMDKVKGVISKIADTIDAKAAKKADKEAEKQDIKDSEAKIKSLAETAKDTLTKYCPKNFNAKVTIEPDNGGMLLEIAADKIIEIVLAPNPKNVAEVIAQKVITPFDEKDISTTGLSNIGKLMLSLKDILKLKNVEDIYNKLKQTSSDTPESEHTEDEPDATDAPETAEADTEVKAKDNYQLDDIFAGNALSKDELKKLLNLGESFILTESDKPLPAQKIPADNYIKVWNACQGNESKKALIKRIIKTELGISESDINKISALDLDTYIKYVLKSKFNLTDKRANTATYLAGRYLKKNLKIPALTLEALDELLTRDSTCRQKILKRIDDDSTILFNNKFISYLDPKLLFKSYFDYSKVFDEVVTYKALYDEGKANEVNVRLLEDILGLKDDDLMSIIADKNAASKLIHKSIFYKPGTSELRDAASLKAVVNDLESNSRTLSAAKKVTTPTSSDITTAEDDVKSAAASGEVADKKALKTIVNKLIDTDKLSDSELQELQKLLASKL